MNGKYTILPVFYSNEVNIGSMGSEILRHTGHSETCSGKLI